YRFSPGPLIAALMKRQFDPVDGDSRDSHRALVPGAACVANNLNETGFAQPDEDGAGCNDTDAASGQQLASKRGTLNVKPGRIRDLLGNAEVLFSMDQSPMKYIHAVLMLPLLWACCESVARASPVEQPVYEVYAVRYATMRGFPVAALVQGADKWRK